MLRRRRPSDLELEHLLAGARQCDLSYAEAGATRSGAAPAGYRLDHYERHLGVGDELLGRAARAPRAWQGQRGAGVEVYPRDEPVAEGQTVLFVLWAFGIWTIAPCRVVYLVDEPRTFVFAYGALPGHPERGEVAMSVERDETGAVTARVESFSHTVDPLARAARPATRALQKRLTNGYLAALDAAT
jgi:uncharacterized protein (UPF0548 family)